jgi:hypothetical protein
MKRLLSWLRGLRRQKPVRWPVGLKFYRYSLHHKVTGEIIDLGHAPILTPEQAIIYRGEPEYWEFECHAQDMPEARLVTGRHGGIDPFSLPESERKA